MTSYLPELPVGEIKSQVNGSQERILALVPSGSNQKVSLIRPAIGAAPLQME